jgi:hypothetical protein
LLRHAARLSFPPLSGGAPAAIRSSASRAIGAGELLYPAEPTWDFPEAGYHAAAVREIIK